MVVDTVDVNFFTKEYGVNFNDLLPDGSWWAGKARREEPSRRFDSHSAETHGSPKALAINTSPDKNNGVVARLLDPFLEGMKSAGFQVELYYARDLVIFPCCGNLNCTVRTPGNCMAYDDMRWLRQKIGQADVLILASPLYFNGIVGPEGATVSLKSLLSRLVPVNQAPLEVPYEHAVHTTREAVSLRKVVIASGCGFWEIGDFYPVLTHIKALCYNTFPDFAGNITGESGVLLRGALENGTSDIDIREVSRKAGIELANADKATVESQAGLETRTRDIYSQIIGMKEQ